MRVLIAAVFVSATAFRTKVLRRREHTSEQDGASLWVPMAVPGRATQYLNPVTGETRGAPPTGALVTAAARVQGYVDPIYAEPGVQLVPNETRKSCVPHCTWNCTQPVCEQGCKPVCRAGTCETRCPKMNQTELEKCHVQCAEPVCKMFCPKGNLCSNNSTLGCPKCATRCEEPQCNFVCNHDVDSCTTVCPQPVCTFDCVKKECPHPTCNMVCESPPDCGVRPTSPPVSNNEFVVGESTAGVGTAEWVAQPWQKCSTECGKGVQLRDVHCNTKHDDDCSGLRKPEISRPCEEHSGCLWTPGEWGKCSSECGQGTQTRKVLCSGPKCLADRPATEQPCQGDNPACTQCMTRVYGGPKFDGWSLDFAVGEYSVADMEAMGAKCDDISSLKVVGHFCEVTAYEYGDFNAQHPGWSAKFTEGEYDKNGLYKAGAKDNDISSMKVYMTSGSSNQTFPGTSVPIIPRGIPKVVAPDGWDRSRPRSASIAAGGMVAVVMAVLA
mmetsp:Transcript_15198/g.33912  ORF Transcript_15198/g.33912 Transcript_15198/m.33912 type:complete len:497 (-) Transcript_15198:62-1552(-)|eukprot:CAMPEP_0204275120 /NCGR_PEP_ID=MMETSP0468-20130131/25574_1 /ASSEMBLY_ACC=CAM_ASM_000383 /TAXON_ID=2969 /ORGANISM="Oxyrrhis marina" /LENGTH=496 /DNA_ID=CAMNT_0051251413 /DNA_START=112 /DNA_END=1602 /DNA_ORIENTATION=-